VQAIADSNREKLQPLVDVALRCSTNATAAATDSLCSATSLSMAIAAVAGVQQFNMSSGVLKWQQISIFLFLPLAESAMELICTEFS
jgi:hypothetical protein